MPDNDTQKFLDTRVGDAEIIHIQNSHLLDSEISYIQSISHCHVYPSRCEGFCLPAIESMAHGKLTIATRYSGFLDFCNDENSILIDYAIQSAVDSEFVFPGSKWAEPDVNDLAQKMRFIYDSFQTGKFKENFSRLMKSAFETAKQFSWDNIAERLLKILKSAAGIDKLKSRRFVKITPYNDQTGIAEYSKQIVTGIKNSFEKCWVFANDDSNTKNLEDEDYVVRNWTCGEKSFSRVLDFITDNNVDTVHIQFHSSTFFSEDSLSKLIKCLKEQNIKVFLTLHSVVGKNFDHIKNIESLNLCDKVLVTSKSDLHYARKYISNVVYAPLFVDLVLPYPKPWIKRQLGLDENETLISTHGLLNTNKSVMQIIEGFQIFLQDYPNSKLVLLNAVSLDNYASTSLFNQIKSYLKEKTLDHKVLFISDFLDVNVVNKILNASDIYVLAYTDVGESGSAAVKKGLQNEVVTVVTDIKQFDEYKDEVIKIPDNNPETIATILKKLKSSPDIYKSQLQKIKEYNKKRNIVNVQVDHLVLYL
ncbi:glycosyltransferase [Candidatus Dojkabacteria bacterium]|uniref:Glycosyltransferase n=1 Tax=Candidatus Dojkabacteria bacterium TaxID=2099670 RepID=A0A3M0Z277_9BACT|nr:MAG: glycosyltransferase [Candidatus Dojkabacteria bacterium]